MRKVLFDLDGTLYKTEISIGRAVNETMARLKLPPVDEEVICRHIGKTMDEYLKAILPADLDLTAFSEVFRGIERKAITEHGRLYDGINEMLGELKSRGYSLYICSNGSEGYIRLVLESTGAIKYFDGIISSKFDTSKGAAIKRNITDNDFAVMVGDTIIDYEAAREAGIPVIAAAYGYGSKEDIPKASFTANAPSELLNKVIKAELFHTITESLIYKRKCRIIGISGVDTSGKTVFSVELSRYLRSLGIINEVLHMDDFHNPSEIRYRGYNEIVAYYDNAFNYTQVIDEILDPLIREGSFDKEINCLNLDTDSYDICRRFTIDKDTLLIIEGVLLFREPINSYLEGKIYLDIDFDEVLKRAAVRDVPRYGEAFLNKYMDKYIPVQKRYLTQWDPVNSSDIVIDNSDYDKPAVKRIK